jgi:hypothetical protein
MFRKRVLVSLGRRGLPARCAVGKKLQAKGCNGWSCAIIQNWGWSRAIRRDQRRRQKSRSLSGHICHGTQGLLLGLSVYAPLHDPSLSFVSGPQSKFWNLSIPNDGFDRCSPSLILGTVCGWFWH